eukprot:TRINITY_DN549_c2_g1_i2.p2 TRINITY_DN549_c2_g1~~TRINITY_DN549_c2_g1_i2.p2  ORF type:complete len:555 (+),score=191.60 TRINITY_DN549_c2_g1_i2:231-1895(+)
MGGVPEFLKQHGLEEYGAVFAENGFDDMADVLQLTDSDLLAIGIDKLGHRRKIMRVLEANASKKALSRSGYASKRPGEMAFIPPPAPEGAPEAQLGEEVMDDENEFAPKSHHRKGRRRSNTYTPSSPVMKVRTQPRMHHGGDKIVVEVLAAKLEDKEKQSPQVKMSVCKTIDSKGIPIESTVRRTSVLEGNHPAWHEVFEFPAILTDQTYLVFAVNSKNGFSSKRIGLIAIPMKFFVPFTDETVVDNWFPLKLGQGQRTGEIHLRLRVPGGVPSQVGKAYKVTGVKMDTRKLVVEVIEAMVPLSSKGNARSTYVKLTLPDKDFVCRETTVRKETKHPRWYESFDFFTEVKNSQYLIVKLKNHKLMSHKTLGIAKIPLLFFLSLKDKAELDSWFVCRDVDGREAGMVRARMYVRTRTDSERGQMWGRESGVPVASPVPNLPLPSKNSPLADAVRARTAQVNAERAAMVASTESSAPLLQDEQLEEEGDVDEEAEEDLDQEDEEEVEEDDTWDVDDHEEDMTPYSPTRAQQSGGVFWPPPDGKRVDSDLVQDGPAD